MRARQAAAVVPVATTLSTKTISLPSGTGDWRKKSSVNSQKLPMHYNKFNGGLVVGAARCMEPNRKANPEIASFESNRVTFVTCP